MKEKTLYFCKECGNEYAKWQGRCPACGAWNSIEEVKEKTSVSHLSSSSAMEMRGRAKKLSDIVGSNEIRFSTGMKELDRVLGGGAVKGSLVLLGGTPGIGKSTLLLQICQSICKSQSVLYASGEESEQQIKLRAVRLGVDSQNLMVLCETCLDDILAILELESPEILIIDSIQTLYLSKSESAPGSVSQVRDCTMALLQYSKKTNTTVFIVGHVNKDGAIAGPKILEHMVDCVMYFEGDKTSAYRLLRTAKNRFGSTNEIGVFEMMSKGLVEISNPSEALLQGRPKGASGTCVACPMEGSRPILAEIQALVTHTIGTNPRRAVDGIDYNRAILLIAVLEKRAKLKLSEADVYLNVIGGLQIDEPAADLPIALSIASGYFDKAVDDQMAAVGEIGMTGELRSVTDLEKRLLEISRLGFTSCLVPRQGSEGISVPDSLKLIRAKNINEVFALLF